MDINKKLELLDSFGLDAVLVIPFNRKFSNISAFDFLSDIIVKKFKPSHVIIGYDHHFGHHRGGSSKFLKSFGLKNGFKVEVVGPISDEDVIISSTHIRELIKSGYVRRASFELGWVYGFEAKVVHGSGRGKNMNFPTANFIPVNNNQLIPAHGVYFTRGRINGNNLYGMCNLGIRPTFSEKEFVMEVNFFQNNLDGFYNNIITVEFLERIRDEQKFSNPQALVKQLIIDKKTCLDLLKKYN
ncbi:MAG: riboflavin kinase, partial [Candidatus Neomarinimicrobiota bacterium]